jgi:hypothetical protein
MDKLVRRVTVIHRGRDEPRAVAVYRAPEQKEHKEHKEHKERARVSVLTRPLQRGARHLEKAILIFGQETLRRHEDSNRRRRDGWLLEGPSNLIESGREALNEARKAVPFPLPKL